MSTTQLIFDVSKLMETTIGTREMYSFEIPLDFEGFKTMSSTAGKAEIMRIEDAFNAKIMEVEVALEFTCEHCLKKYSQTIKIPMAERQFLFKAPEKVEDPSDLYLLNSQNSTLDLSEMLRQEIILHFPLIPVCSKSCKGICSVCAKNRNEQPCKCEPETIRQQNKPLAVLKELFKK